MLTNKRFISIGTNCDIAYNIKEHFNVETNFFDWAKTQFDSLLYILNLKNIKDLFLIDNIDIDLKLCEKYNDISITFKNFNDKNSCLTAPRRRGAYLYNYSYRIHHYQSTVRFAFGYRWRRRLGSAEILAMTWCLVLLMLMKHR